MSRVPLSLVDFSDVRTGERPRDGIARSVAIARRAEELGFSRIWYSEHHNMRRIASSSPAVMIAHIAARTSRIRLGAGGVMLPNHSPYVIAEQFGTLEEMYPGRIDLGLGRAPGTDQTTLRALRRSPMASDHFPNDVVELMAWLSDESPLNGVEAIPGAGTNVPLYILGSSLFGAQLAAQLGLPYSFASHFAPAMLEDAVHVYRTTFQPSKVLAEPYVIAAVNVAAADSEEEAKRFYEDSVRRQAAGIAFRGRTSAPSEEQIDQLMQTPFGQQAAQMLSCAAVGTGEQVAEYLDDFTQTAQADELMVTTRSPSTEQSLHSLEILATGWGLDPENTAGDPTGWNRG